MPIRSDVTSRAEGSHLITSRVSTNRVVSFRWGYFYAPPQSGSLSQPGSFKSADRLARRRRSARQYTGCCSLRFGIEAATTKRTILKPNSAMADEHRSPIVRRLDWRREQAGRRCMLVPVALQARPPQNQVDLPKHAWHRCRVIHVDFASQ